MTTPTVYRPAPSRGRLWLGGLGLLTLALGSFGVWSMTLTGAPWAALLLGPAEVGVSLIFLLPFFWFPTMRYELDEERLVMRCGPLSYRVHLADVQRVTKRDLAMSMWSSMRLPGFALGDVIYGDVGNVTMCATRALKGIILLEAGRKKYGLTPADEDAFLADLRRRLAAVSGRRPA